MSNPVLVTPAEEAPDSSEANGSDTGNPQLGRPARNFGAQAFIDTFSRIGARFGAAWIAVLVLAAVFAPFIANSQPVLVKTGGHWSSPLLHHLTSGDVTLLAVFFTAIVLVLLRVGPLTTFACVLWVAAFVLPMTLWSAVRDGWRPGGSVSPLLGLSLLWGLALADLAVLVGVPWFSQASPRLRQGFAIAAIPVVALLIFFPINPPENVVHEQWRDLQTAGQLQSVLRTIVPYSASDYQRDRPEARLQPPSRHHWMGTEDSGADVFSRMLHASRIALSIGFIATGISVAIGVTIGGLMGYFAGIVDILGMRLIEIFEALPQLILLLTFCAFFGRNLYLMMAIIGLLSWPGDARFIRGEFLRLRNQDFVQAAIASGLPLRSVIFRHMLINGITPVLVSSSFNVANAILLEATLSFLGLGLVDEPSWGQLLNQARAGGTGFIWWLATFPGLAIFLTVFAYNLIGEAVRDAIDPKLRKRD